MKTMHYFKSGLLHYYVYGEDGKIPPHATKWVCGGKRDARKTAKAENVKPWNF